MQMICLVGWLCLKGAIIDTMHYECMVVTIAAALAPPPMGRSKETRDGSEAWGGYRRHEARRWADNEWPVHLPRQTGWGVGSPLQGIGPPTHVWDPVLSRSMRRALPQYYSWGGRGGGRERWWWVTSTSGLWTGWGGGLYISVLVKCSVSPPLLAWKLWFFFWQWAVQGVTTTLLWLEHFCILHERLFLNSGFPKIPFIWIKFNYIQFIWYSPISQISLRGI